tara:strand:- start:54 stop:512 length:459 start_codon:yes stop_codon:yes gene_type:complete
MKKATTKNKSVIKAHRGFAHVRKKPKRTAPVPLPVANPKKSKRGLKSDILVSGGLRPPIDSNKGKSKKTAPKFPVPLPVSPGGGKSPIVRGKGKKKPPRLGIPKNPRGAIKTPIKKIKAPNLRLTSNGKPVKPGIDVPLASKRRRKRTRKIV